MLRALRRYGAVQRAVAAMLALRHYGQLAAAAFHATPCCVDCRAAACCQYAKAMLMPPYALMPVRRFHTCLEEY